MMETDALVHSAEVEGENGFAIRRLRLGLVADAGPLAHRRGHRRVHLGHRAQRPPLGGLPRRHPLGPAAPDLRLPPHAALSHRQGRALRGHVGARAAAWPCAPSGPGVDLGLEAALPADRQRAYRSLGCASATAPGRRSATTPTSWPTKAGSISVLGRPRAPSHRRRLLRPAAWGSAGTSGTQQNRARRGGHHRRRLRLLPAGVVNGLQSIGEGHVAAWLGRTTLDVEGAYVNEQRGQNGGEKPTGALPPLPSVDSWGGFAEAAYMLLGAPRMPGGWPNQNPWNARLRRAAWRWRPASTTSQLDQGASDVTPGGAKGGELAVRWWATQLPGREPRRLLPALRRRAARGADAAQLVADAGAGDVSLGLRNSVPRRIRSDTIS